MNPTKVAKDYIISIYVYNIIYIIHYIIITYVYIPIFIYYICIYTVSQFLTNP